MNPPVLLDISRLISRAGRPTPSGIDRIELAYAEHLLARIPGRLGFAAINGAGDIAPVPNHAARRLIAALARHWRTPSHGSQPARRAGWLARLSALLPAHLPAEPVYLHVSHQNLHHPKPFARLKARTGAAFVFLVHDLIPIDFPEYARPGQAERHRHRIATMCALADGLIANSAATAASITPHLTRAIPIIVAHPGIDLPGQPTPPPPTQPAYFVCLGTIEPRKNHLLLLHIWRRLAERRTPATPRLEIIGHRGWENEMVLDMLDRCTALGGLVTERSSLGDQDLRPLLAGACALLNPSFAEGYGMPVAEALAQGVPVLCSDIPAHREVGGPVPEFLDPLDGPAWLQAIEAYAPPNSPRRTAQLARLPTWHPPQWPDHIEAVLTLLDRVHGRPVARQPSQSLVAPPVP